MPGADGKDYLRMSTVALAWLGDAVYELCVREILLGRGHLHADKLHTAAVRYVRADAQAAVMRQLADTLPEEEQALVRRARNRRITTKPKNADPMDYKWATAFEALIGYYRLSGRQEEIEAVVASAVALIDAKGKTK
jgi:ribonuclease-3 family protein